MVEEEEVQTIEEVEVPMWRISSEYQGQNLLAWRSVFLGLTRKEFL